MTIRHFNASRESGKNNIASQIMRLEIQKKGKFEPAERYKMILQEKLEANRMEAMKSVKTSFRLPGAKITEKKISKKAEQAMKELAMKKAIKKAREMRKRVIITPRQYGNGRLTKDGKIYDIAGNVVGRVDKKTGKMTTNAGWAIGKYKPRSASTDTKIQHAINQFSPYFIQQRKLALLQQQAAYAQAMGYTDGESINIYGHRQSGPSNVWGGPVEKPRYEVAGMTAWGAMSNNVHGTFVDNAWGTAVDNVWGGVDSNVWGGIGGGSGSGGGGGIWGGGGGWGSGSPTSLWGVKGRAIWGTGNGINILGNIGRRIAGYLGLGYGKAGNREKLAAISRARSGARSR